MSVQIKEMLKTAARPFVRPVLAKIGSIAHFLTEDSYEPDSIEHEISDEKLEKMLHHIEEVWNNYGTGETFWSILTDDQYKKKNIADTIDNFYRTGLGSVKIIKTTLRRCGEENLLNYSAKAKCLEYGCGVGRITVHLARMFKSVLGIDISRGHLKLADEALSKYGAHTAALKLLNGFHELNELGTFDFIVSFIVLQHNPPPIIAKIIDSFFKIVNPGGIVMFQVPVRIKNYTFRANEYMQKMTSSQTMEMHALPQTAILKIARNNNCYPLEIQNNDMTGSPLMISQTFVFKKG